MDADLVSLLITIMTLNHSTVFVRLLVNQSKLLNITRDGQLFNLACLIYEGLHMLTTMVCKLLCANSTYEVESQTWGYFMASCNVYKWTGKEF